MEENDFKLIVSDEAASIENFYSGPHFSHVRKWGYENNPPQPGELKTVPLKLTKQANITEDEINALERREGISLPELLKKLYLIQNGGSVRSFWVPAQPQINPSVANESHDGWIAPFEGYDSLDP